MALLAYLAVTGEPQQRDTFATMFWPDSSQSAARTALRRDLSALHRALDKAWLVIDRETIGLRHEPELWLDVAEFQQRVAGSQSHTHPAAEPCAPCLAALTEAAALYRDDFLAGFTLPDCPDFDEWQFFHTESLRQSLAAALERLVQAHRSQEDHEAAIPYARRWLALNPLHEPAHRQLMQLYAQTGQQAAALRQYQLCVQILEEELGVLPSAELTTLYERIRTGAVKSESPAVQSPPALLSHPLAILHNLPPQPTPFVGRVEDLKQIIQRLADPTCRLLTLVGPGGIGKTRLAIQAAQNLIDTQTELPAFAGGPVTFVSLAPVSSPFALVSTIADALEFSFYSDVPPKQQLLDYLREKKTLLILDNFEHLLAGADLIADILAAAPGVRIVVTSREALNLAEEWLYPIAGMRYPEGTVMDETMLEGYGVVQLFVQRAKQVNPNFSLAAEREGVVRICRLVEGMPLGIELAAAWSKMFTCAQISQEIERSLDFLTTSLRNVSPRHRSMRAVFESAWDLLSKPQQDVLSQLSIFRGDFHREVAEVVTGASFPLLVALVEKSLLQPTPSGCYHMHELLRQFAAEKLQASPSQQAITQSRHSNYYLAFLQQRAAGLKGRQQQAILSEIQEEFENVRAGWNWAVEQGQVASIEQAMDSLYDFYQIRSRFQEGQEAFARAAGSLQALKENRSELALAKVLAREGAFCAYLGLNEPAITLLQAGLELARQLEASREMAFCLNFLGDIRYVQGKPEEAKQLYQESLALHREMSDREGVVSYLLGLAWIFQELGEYIEAKECYQESLAISREIGAPDAIASSLDQLGVLAFMTGDYSESSQYYQESLAIFTEIGNQLGIAKARGGLGLVAWGMGGRLVEAKQYLEESLAVCRETGHRYEMCVRLYFLGRIANGMGAYETAQQYGREALVIARALDSPQEAANALACLGEAACGLGDLPGARQHLFEALTFLAIVKDAWATLLTLEIWAGLLVQESDLLNQGDALREAKREEALKLLPLIARHLIVPQIIKDRAARLLAKLEGEMPLEAVTAAQAWGEARTLEKVVAEVVTRASGNSPPGFEG